MSETLSSTVSSIIFYAGLFLICLGIPRLFKVKTSREELGLKGLPTWADIGLAIIAFFVYIFLAAILVKIFSYFPWFNAEETQDVGFNNLLSASDRLLAAFSLIILAPVCEEVLFRGWLYRKLRKLFKGKRGIAVAILIVSALFALLHGQWNVAVNVFAMSVILCLQRELTGTIWSGILLHMIKNAVAFYLLYIVV